MAIAPSNTRPGGTPSRCRSSRSPRNTPKNSAPRPASSAASSIVITDIDASIVQYGTGHASGPAPRPVWTLSGSAYRSVYAFASAKGSAMTGVELWAILGPALAGFGLALAIVALRRR